MANFELNLEQQLLRIFRKIMNSLYITFKGFLNSFPSFLYFPNTLLLQNSNVIQKFIKEVLLFKREF